MVDGELEDGELEGGDTRGYFGVESSSHTFNSESLLAAQLSTARKRNEAEEVMWNHPEHERSGSSFQRERSLEEEQPRFHESRKRQRENQNFRYRSRSPRPAAMIKPPEFPKDIPSEGKFEAWLDWVRVFKTSMELAGSMSQRMKANYLTLFGGEELRQIIAMRRMMPDVDAVQEDYRFFDKLVRSLSAYFREMTDPTIDVVAFMNAKQESKESAREFEIRLRRLADRCSSEPGEDMIKTRFIQGMRDREMAHRACIEAMDLEALVTRATRQEAFGKAKVQGSFDPWSGGECSQVAAAVSYGKETRQQSAARFKPKMNRLRPWAGRDNRASSNRTYRTHDSCKSCGLSSHRFGSCPAVGRECNRCRKVGHFERVCVASVSAMSTEAPKRKQRNESNEVVFYE